MMRKSIVVISLVVLFVLLLTGLGVAQAQEPVEEWVARYQHSGGNSIAYDIVVDGSGNAYVTGESSGDYATIKYDSNGLEQWVQRYDGPGNSLDSACAIAIDRSGNVYVTGYSGDEISADLNMFYRAAGAERDYATIKYDVDGNQLWVARYNSSTNSRDEAKAIAVDALGNVYVTGCSDNSSFRGNYNGNQYDYATIKYDTDGNQLWVTRYDGSDNRRYSPALAVDGSGNVYITGTSNQEGVTVKYDTNGNQLWEEKYDTSDLDHSNSSAMAVDDSGNVYVTGTSFDHDEFEYRAFNINTRTNLWEYTTIKYDTDGNQLWVAKYSSSTTAQDEATAIAVDGSGNVYVTGNGRITPRNNSSDYTTIKYNNDGVEQWVQKYNGPDNYGDHPKAIAVDSMRLAGNVYVTGSSSGGYVTVKYDTYGDQIWIKSYNMLGTGEATAIAVDGSGNVYVAGNGTDGYSPVGYTTIKYLTEGLIKEQASQPSPLEVEEPAKGTNICLIAASVFSLLAIANIVVLVLIFRRRSAGGSK